MTWGLSVRETQRQSSEGGKPRINQAQHLYFAEERTEVQTGQGTRLVPHLHDGSPLCSLASLAQCSHNIRKRLYTAWDLVEDIDLKVITSFRLNTYMELLKLHFQKWG